MPTLYTSLTEIRSFNPCASGWKTIISAHPHSTEEERNKQFPLLDCLESNSISDVCWLLGRRKVEIQICVKFAKLCADSVAHLKTDATAYAADYAANAADAYAANAAANAAYVADAAANAAYVAAHAAYVANEKQTVKNKQRLIQTILAYENGEL